MEAKQQAKAKSKTKSKNKKQKAKSKQKLAKCENAKNVWTNKKKFGLIWFKIVVSLTKHKFDAVIEWMQKKLSMYLYEIRLFKNMSLIVANRTSIIIHYQRAIGSAWWDPCIWQQFYFEHQEVNRWYYLQWQVRFPIASKINVLCANFFQLTDCWLSFFPPFHSYCVLQKDIQQIRQRINFDSASLVWSLTAFPLLPIDFQSHDFLRKPKVARKPCERWMNASVE